MCFFVWFSGGKRRGDQEKMGFLEKVNGFERIKKGKREIRKSHFNNALKKLQRVSQWECKDFSQNKK